MSPNQVIPMENGALSPIAERVMKCPSLTYDYSQDGIVIAKKAELIVRTGPFDTSPTFRDALMQVADRVGSLAEIQGGPTEVVRPPDSPPAREAAEYERQADPDYEPDLEGPLRELEIWRLRGDLDSIDESRRLRALVDDERVRTPAGDELVMPAISPNHVSILSPSRPAAARPRHRSRPPVPARRSSSHLHASRPPR